MAKEGKTQAPAKPVQATGVATRRFLKAYILAVRILLSYWFFFFRSRFAGDRNRVERLEALHRKSAHRIEKVLLELGGLFIKVGQLFSVMTNFLPAAFRDGLAHLQDAVPAKPYSQIASQIQLELGDLPDNVFASFERDPIASASLGQVHRAVTPHGDDVVVKVRHQNVHAMADADLRTIWRILKLVEKFVKTRGLDNYYHEIKAMIIEELDFEIEAQNILKISANFEGDDKIVFPEVFPSYSGKTVLTLGYIDGVKITEVETLRSYQLDLADIATRLVNAYCQMIFIDGVYHADPHPGNIKVTADGRIVLLDFGAVGVLSSKMRGGLGNFVDAIIKGDEKFMLHSLYEMGFLRVGANETEAAERVIEYFHRKVSSEIKFSDFSLSSIQIDPGKGFEHVADIHAMGVGIRELSGAFHIPGEWVLLERTGIQLTGICTTLEPGMNPAQVIKPYLEEFVLGEERDWSTVLFDLTRERLLSALALPREFEKYFNHLLSGKLRVRIDQLSSVGHLVYLAIQQFTFAFLAVGSTGLGIYFDLCHPAYAQYAFGVAGGFLLLMLTNMIRAGKHKRAKR